jgi:hypothetical protein
MCRFHFGKPIPRRPPAPTSTRYLCRLQERPSACAIKAIFPACGHLPLTPPAKTAVLRMRRTSKWPYDH